MIGSADVCDLSLSPNATLTATGKAIRESGPQTCPSMTAGELNAMSAAEPHSITGLIRSSSRPRVPLYDWPGLQPGQALAAITFRALPPSLAAYANQTTEHNLIPGPRHFTTPRQNPALRQSFVQSQTQGPRQTATYRHSPTHRHSGAGRNPHPVPMVSGLHRNDVVGHPDVVGRSNVVGRPETSLPAFHPAVSLPEDC